MEKIRKKGRRGKGERKKGGKVGGREGKEKLEYEVNPGTVNTGVDYSLLWGCLCTVGCLVAPQVPTH
jgi:hypothetical protein